MQFLTEATPVAPHSCDQNLDTQTQYNDVHVQLEKQSFEISILDHTILLQTRKLNTLVLTGVFQKVSTHVEFGGQMWFRFSKLDNFI